MIPDDSRLVLLMHDHVRDRHGKMGFGLLRYGRYRVAAVVDRSCSGLDLTATLGIATDAPVVASVAESVALGADTLVIAVATSGGVLPPDPGGAPLRDEPRERSAWCVRR